MAEIPLSPLQWLGLLLGMIALSCMICKSISYFLQILKGKKNYIRPLFKGFKEKMWMTIGLGFLFFGLYLALVLLGSSIIDLQVGLKLFFLSYEHPTEFIYLGLFAFACLSLFIYLVRMMIKYFYITRSKGS